MHCPKEGLGTAEVGLLSPEPWLRLGGGALGNVLGVDTPLRSQSKRAEFSLGHFRLAVADLSALQLSGSFRFSGSRLPMLVFQADELRKVVKDSIS